MNVTAILPGAGRTRLADLVPDAPLGRLTGEIAFGTATGVSFHVIGGAIAGRTAAEDTTTAAEVRDGLSDLRWTEPDSGDHRTHVEDHAQGACTASSGGSPRSIPRAGAWRRVRGPRKVPTLNDRAAAGRSRRAAAPVPRMIGTP